MRVADSVALATQSIFDPARSDPVGPLIQIITDPAEDPLDS